MKLQHVSLLSAVIAALPVMAQDPGTADPLMIARVTGSNVYVRSGPSTNYYPVTRLDLGDRVVVHDTTLGWASIVPPAGTFSLIHKEFVDPDGADAGVVNGDRVWVYAGSELSKQRYAKQLKLNRGESVHIVGELEQYYKIVPPTGARLWITEDYLEKTGEAVAEQLAATPQPQPRPAVDDPVIAEPSAQADPPADTAQTVPDPVEEQPVVQPRETIETIEADLKLEFAKPPLERNLQPLIQRFESLAGAATETTVRQYARYRIAQLQRSIEQIEALREMDSLRQQLEAERQRFEQERVGIRPEPLPAEPQFDARGRLLMSSAYRNPSGPQRYRLVRPQSGSHVPATVAYVEVDPQSGIDPHSYLGRYVGVRARGRKYLDGTVNPVLVYTAEEIVVLDEPVRATLSSNTP